MSIKKVKGRQSLGIKSRTPGLCSQCSATDLQQPDNLGHLVCPCSQCSATTTRQRWKLSGKAQARCPVAASPFTFHYCTS